MRFVEISESRVDYLRTAYAEKLTAYSQLFGKHDQTIIRNISKNKNTFDFLLNTDPSDKKIYTQWLINLFLKGNLRPEDAAKANNYLSIFDKYKSKLKLDINQIKSLPDLYIAIKKYDTFAAAFPTEQGIEELIKSGDVSLRYKGPEGAIYQANTEKGACYLGRGTEWCTTYGDPFGKYPDRDENAFKEYSKDLLVIFTKDGRYQFSFYESQLMDEEDNSVNFRRFDYKYPWVFENLQYSENDQIAAVKHKCSAMQFIKNPSEKVQLAAAKSSPRGLKYIKNPSEEMKIAAVKSDGNAIAFINDPSEQLKMLAVQTNAESILQIKNPSEELKIAAVSRDGRAIAYIRNPSEAVKKAAVKQNPRALDKYYISGGETHASLGPAYVHRNEF